MSKTLLGLKYHIWSITNPFLIIFTIKTIQGQFFGDPKFDNTKKFEVTPNMALNFIFHEAKFRISFRKKNKLGKTLYFQIGANMRDEMLN